MGARGSAFVAELGDPADFVEGESGRLGIANERQALKCMIVVVAVTAGRSLRFMEESEAFVEANRPWMNACMFGKFTDSHRSPILIGLKIPLDLLL